MLNFLKKSQYWDAYYRICLSVDLYCTQEKFPPTKFLLSSLGAVWSHRYKDPIPSFEFSHKIWLYHVKFIKGNLVFWKSSTLGRGSNFSKKVQVPSGPDTGQGELGQKVNLEATFPRELFLYILGVTKKEESLLQLESNAFYVWKSL
jgi:hypothetical protein